MPKLKTKTTKKAAPKKAASKKSRPSFSAPTPPEKDEVVENAPELEEEIVDNSKDIKEDPASPVPPKFITKDGPDKETSFDQVIKEEEPQEETQKTKKTAAAAATTAVVAKDAPVKVKEVDLDEPEADIKETKEEVIEDKDSSNSTSLLKIGLIIILIIFAVTGWFLLFTTKYPDMFAGGVSLPGSEPTPVPTVQPAPPSPTPVDKSGVAIEVYNGVGISGAAGTTADTLESMGYTIIDTGNADSSGYEVTQIDITPEFPEDLLEVFLADLKEEYGVASISGELEEALDSGANTQITLGADWFPEE